LGDGIFGVALAWQALELSGNPATLGLVLLCRSLSRLLVLLVARLPDRLRHEKPFSWPKCPLSDGFGQEKAPRGRLPH
jgi:hypothetical protein